MKFDVNRLMMLEAAKSTAKIAPSNSPLEVLNGILVESCADTGLTFLTATDHQISIQQKVMASVKESGAMLINSRILVGMMTLLRGEFVTFSADKPQLITVTSGKSMYRINCLPAKSYPKPVMPFPEESVIMSGICSLAKRTTFLVSKDDKKPALQCVNIKLRNNAVHATATDGMGMMLVKDSAESTEEREFLLPGYALGVLASISDDSDVFEVSDTGKNIVFVRGDMIFTIRKMATGDYIDTNSLVKNIKPLYAALTETGKMKAALSLISAGTRLGAAHTPINLILSDNEIILRCNSDHSEGNTSVPANVSRSTPDTGFYYDVSALLKLFNVLNGKVKLELDAKGFMMIKTRSEVYLQSPMRPPVKKPKAVKPAKEKESAEGAEDMKVTA